MQPFSQSIKFTNFGFKLPFCIDFNTSTQFLYPLVSMILVLVKSSLNPKIFEKFPGNKKSLLLACSDVASNGFGSKSFKFMLS